MTKLQMLSCVILMALIATFTQFVIMPEVMKWVEPKAAEAQTNEDWCRIVKRRPVNVADGNAQKVLDYCASL